MAQLAFTGRESVGRVQIERFGNSLRLRWSSNCKRYSLTVGRDSRDTLKAARAKAQAIDSDITFDRFDSTLEKYGKKQRPPLEVASPDKAPKTQLRQLWDKFLAYKLPHLKPATQQEYDSFDRLLDKVEALGNDALSFDALKTKQNLLAVTTVDQTKRVLQYLSACCEWSIRQKIITENPYKGLAADMPKRQSQLRPDADAFTEEEREAVIAAFKTNKRPGANYSHYAPTVEFWFFTDCRPSEAVGLTWGNVSEDCSIVVFNGSIQTIRGVQVRSVGSKNNNSRSVTG